MKKYEMVSHICQHDHDEFMDRLSSRIDEYQKKGLQVELQYAINPLGLYTVLVTGYKEVQE